MNGLRNAPHLNPLPGGERRVTPQSDPMMVAEVPGSHERSRQKRSSGKLACAEQIRLSVSQGERIEVRDCSRGASPTLTKSLVKRCSVLRVPDGSKIGLHVSRVARKTDLASDHGFDQLGHCVRHRQAQSRASLKGNRNRERTDRSDVGAEICGPRNFGFADDAKQRVPILWAVCAGNEHDSQDYLTKSVSLREAGSAPYLTPLPWSGERRIGQRVASTMPSATTESVASIRLSLSQRERIEVRDWLS